MIDHEGPHHRVNLWNPMERLMSKRRFGLAIACGIGVGAGLFFETRPRIHTARPEEVLALVPADLLQVPPGDPSAERRLDRIVALAGAPGDWARSDWPRRLEAILDEGPLRIPEGGSSNGRKARQVALKAYKGRFAALLDHAGYEPDSGRSEFVVRLGLRLFDALDRAGGDLEDARDLNGFLGMVSASYGAYGHYGSVPKGGRARLLAMAPLFGPRSETLADATVADFRSYAVPFLIDAAKGPGALDRALKPTMIKGAGAGTFDPLETTRLFVTLTKLESAALRSTDRKAKAAPGLFLWRTDTSHPSPTSPGLLGTIRFHWAMDHSPNSLGRMLVWLNRAHEAETLLRQRNDAWNRIQKNASRIR